MVFSKEILNFFAPENMTKTPAKVTTNFFFQYCPNGPKTQTLTPKSPLLQEWVFRQIHRKFGIRETCDEYVHSQQYFSTVFH